MKIIRLPIPCEIWVWSCFVLKPSLTLIPFGLLFPPLDDQHHKEWVLQTSSGETYQQDQPSEDWNPETQKWCRRI